MILRQLFGHGLADYRREMGPRGGLDWRRRGCLPSCTSRRQYHHQQETTAQIARSDHAYRAKGRTERCNQTRGELSGHGRRPTKGLRQGNTDASRSPMFPLSRLAVHFVPFRPGLAYGVRQRMVTFPSGWADSLQDPRTTQVSLAHLAQLTSERPAYFPGPEPAPASPRVPRCQSRPLCGLNSSRRP